MADRAASWLVPTPSKWKNRRWRPQKRAADMDFSYHEDEKARREPYSSSNDSHYSCRLDTMYLSDSASEELANCTANHSGDHQVERRHDKF